MVAILLWCTGYSFFHFKLNRSFEEESVVEFEKLFQIKEKSLHQSIDKIAIQINEKKSIQEIYNLAKKNAIRSTERPRFRKTIY